MTKPKTAEKAEPSGINFGPGTDSEGNPAQAGNIHEAVIKIMEQIGYVRKTKSGQLDYAYAGEAALIAAIRPWMVYFQVYMTVVDIGAVSEIDRPRTSREGAAYGNTRMVSLTSKVRFTHAPSGTSIDVAARGEGADVSDKANNKAETGAYKYALRQTFCIETGLDPDSQSPAVPGRSGTAPLANYGAGGIDPRDPAFIGDDFDQTPARSPEVPEPPPPYEEGTVGHALGADPRPPAEPLPHKQRLAKNNMDKDDKEWRQWVARLITKYPAYSVQDPKLKKGTTIADLSHIQATALSLGFTTIEPANYQAVLTAIAKHAADKAALFEEPKATEPAKDPKADPAKAAPKPGDKKAPAPGNKQAGGAAKRPSNDEALGRAGF